MTNAGKLSRRGSGVIVVALLLAGAVGCTNGGEDLRAEAADCFGKEPSEVEPVAEGSDFGGWSLFAVRDWDGHDYALDLRAEWSHRGCGYPGDGPVAEAGGGSPYDGKQVRYVYGTATSEVRTVRVRYERGADVDLRPIAVPGFDVRFFVDVREAPSGFDVVGLDAAGNEISQTTTTTPGTSSSAIPAPSGTATSDPSNTATPDCGAENDGEPCDDMGELRPPATERSG